MQKLLRILIAALIVVGILAFMTTYTVRFTETAVVTTFGKADANDVKKDPGLYFKWPYPIQSITTYDNRLRYAQFRAETWSTKDDRQIVVTPYVTWKIEDPLNFFRKYSNSTSSASDHYAQAEDALSRATRSIMAGVVAQYRLGEILSADTADSKLAELEGKVLDGLKAQIGNDAIIPVSVGIRAIGFPEGTTQAIFDRMKATRAFLASDAANKGAAEAQTIRTNAENDAQKILAFAKRRASVIRSQGDSEAAQYYAVQKQDEDLAVFLKNLEFMRNALAKNITLVISQQEPGFGLFNLGAAKRLGPGNMPQFDTQKLGTPAPSSNTPSAPASTPPSTPSTKETSR